MRKKERTTDGREKLKSHGDVEHDLDRTRDWAPRREPPKVQAESKKSLGDTATIGFGPVLLLLCWHQPTSGKHSRLNTQRNPNYVMLETSVFQANRNCIKLLFGYFPLCLLVSWFAYCCRFVASAFACVFLLVLIQPSPTLHSTPSPPPLPYACQLSFVSVTFYRSVSAHCNIKRNIEAKFSFPIFN